MEYGLLTIVFILMVGLGQRDIEGKSFRWGKYFKTVAWCFIVTTLAFMVLFVLKG